MEREVILYTVPGCPLCDAARGWLNRNGLEFSERDVKNDFSALRRMYRLTRQDLVPVIEAKGKVVVRPNAEELANLLL
jgi:glutaredoxin